YSSAKSTAAPSCYYRSRLIGLSKERARAIESFSVIINNLYARGCLFPERIGHYCLKPVQSRTAATCSRIPINYQKNSHALNIGLKAGHCQKPYDSFWSVIR